MNWKYLLLLGSGLLLLSFSILNSSKVAQNGFEAAKEHIIMRQIGHQVLLHTGDTLSRVLPVKKIKNQHYQIRFESPFRFEPDALVRTINAVVTQNNIQQNYVVQVKDCEHQDIVYGYAVFQEKRDDLVPCGNRPQDENCYFLELQFEETNASNWSLYFRRFALLVGVFLCLFGGYKWLEHRKPTAEQIPSSDSNIALGDASFYPEEQYLHIEGSKVKLSPTESKLLLVFAKHPNQIMEKAQLQRAVWNHDAPIVSRSLDVFVSKLRKKMQNIEQVRLVNIPSRGYRLEISD
ncbi:MAG: winged helix-turn-helix domain-containing protein [Bacteroidota bacterium]